MHSRKEQRHKHGKQQSHFEFSDIRANVLSDQYIYLNVSRNHTSEWRVDGDPTLQPNPLAQDIVPASFSQDRTEPILTNPYHYKMAIVRFDCPSTLIPKFLFKELYYYVTMTAIGTGTTDNPQYSESVPLTLTNLQPISAPGTLGNEIFFYSQFLQSLNNGYQLAFDNITAAYAGGLPQWLIDGYPANPPFMRYNSSTKLFSLYSEEEWKEVDQGGSGAQLWMNWPTYYLFSTFMIDFYGYNRGINSDYRDTRLWVQDRDININNSTGTPLLVMTGENPSVNLWYQIYKIIMKTSTINVRNEYIGVNRNGRNITDSILTDFNYEIDSTTDQYGRITFIPTGANRYIDILDEIDMRSLDFEMFYETEGQVLNKIFLQPGEAFNIKVLFQQTD